MTPFYDHKDVLRLYHDAIKGGFKEQAGTLIQIMAEACPFRQDSCLVTKFCPDCDFYKNNGIAPKDKLGMYTELENNIRSKEGE